MYCRETQQKKEKGTDGKSGCSQTMTWHSMAWHITNCHRLSSIPSSPPVLPYFPRCSRSKGIRQKAKTESQEDVRTFLFFIVIFAQTTIFVRGSSSCSRFRFILQRKKLKEKTRSMPSVRAKFNVNAP